MSDFTASGSAATGSAEAAGQKGLNMVLLIQVPLKQKNPMTHKGFLFGAGGGAPDGLQKKTEKSDVENAVIGHGKVEGKYTEIDNLDIERGILEAEVV